MVILPPKMDIKGERKTFLHIFDIAQPLLKMFFIQGMAAEY